MSPKKQPWHYCTSCREYFSIDVTPNSQCSMRYDGKRCKGVIRGALAEGDWVLCQDCEGEGCGICRGSGWRLTK